MESAVPDIRDAPDLRSDHDIRKAYASAVMAYKPWHQHGGWNSSGRDAFWQLVDGGLKKGIFDVGEASALFKVSAKTVESWADKSVLPERKIRLRVWKAIKSHLGL